MPIQPAPFRLEVSDEAVQNILNAVDAGSHFNAKQTQALQVDLEHFRFYHQIEQRRVSPERNPRRIKERAVRISKAAQKILESFDDDEIGKLIYKEWALVFPYDSKFTSPRPKGLIDPPEHVPSFSQFEAGLRYLATVADFTAQYDDFSSHHADGSLISFAVQLLMPLYQSHFGKLPKRTRGKRAGFPEFAVAVCEELQIYNIHGKVPDGETIISAMGKSPKSNGS